MSYLMCIALALFLSVVIATTVNWATQTLPAAHCPAGQLHIKINDNQGWKVRVYCVDPQYITKSKSW